MASKFPISGDEVTTGLSDCPREIGSREKYTTTGSFPPCVCVCVRVGGEG